MNPVHPTAIAVASAYAEARFGLRTAKPQFLKAIDFTIGLVRRMSQMGYKFADAPYSEVMDRLTTLRKQVQDSGLQVQDIEPVLQRFQSKALSLLDNAAAQEQKLIPNPSDWKAFFKTFGDKNKVLSRLQSSYLHDMISIKTGVPEVEIPHRLMEDQGFFKRGYDIVLPALKAVEARSLRTVGGYETVQHRVKSAESCWGKQHGRKSAPFTTFGDLVGLRVVVYSLPELAGIAAQIQKKTRIISKSNRYLENDQYNAMNYKLELDGVGVELQVKTSMNLVEAQISHDLIYSPEKSVLALSPRERELVGMTISASTLIGLKEFSAALHLSE